MRRLRVACLLVIAACGDNLEPPDAALAPALWHPSSLDDATLARRALDELAGCGSCHGLTRAALRGWSALSDTALATCLTDLQLRTEASARATLDCARSSPALTASDFSPRKLGIFAAATHLPWFAYAADIGFGADAPAQLAALRTLAGMPRGASAALSQEQFDLVAEWFVRGLPALDSVLDVQSPPQSCVASIDAGVATHVATMATEGWATRNATNQLAMHGCGAATDPHDCLQSYPARPAWAAVGAIHVLAEATYASSFWTRSSPDGRFVAHGVADIPGGYVVDLQRAVRIPIVAEYDPAFAPDQSGFAFQGGPRNMCPIAVLTANPSVVTMNEPGCRAIAEVGLYEHVAGVAGTDYLVLDSQFVSDDGGKFPTLADPAATFVASARATLTPLVFDGAGYVPGTPQSTATPYEGDSVLSPSGRVLVSRLAGPGDRQLGFVLRSVDTSNEPPALAELARYCVTGGKPAFSFDERYLAFHHYVAPEDAVELGFSGPGDPAFAPYLSAGAANIYLLELTTGTTTRITTMPAGVYALYPHFRSDGWLYAQVRDANARLEVTIASDAAL